MTLSRVSVDYVPPLWGEGTLIQIDRTGEIVRIVAIDRDRGELTVERIAPLAATARAVVPYVCLALILLLAAASVVWMLVA